VDFLVSPLFLAAAGPWYTNSLLIAAIAVVWLILAYRWYGKRIERQLISPGDGVTPANAQRDDVDYYPANRVVLFGHHFASIAGAGPILGPVLAVAYFGWGLTTLWILIGVVLIGAVHDYLALMVSVRHGGSSLPDVAREAVSSPARVLFLIFVWVGLVLVITAFVNAAASTFLAVDKVPVKAEAVEAAAGEEAAAEKEAAAGAEGEAAAGEIETQYIERDTGTRVLIPTFVLMLIAVLFGVMINKLKVKTWLATVIALILLAGAFALGFAFPEGTSLLGMEKGTAKAVWLVVLMVYAIVASVLPVWVLLQPRDYLATWILIFGMGLGFAGIIVVHPTLNAPVFTSVTTAKGPVWPMLFIIVACGAVSGFHCLVAGGTTSKQLAAEGQGLFIGYGSMLTEGALAMLALIAVGAGLYFTGEQAAAAGGGFVLGDFLQPGGGGPITAFGRGFATLAEPFISPLAAALGVAGLGVILGTTMVNAFVMTTLDTSVRLARFITTELLGDAVPLFRNRVVASLTPAIPAFLLAVMPGAFTKIWPMFGAANQLIAALALVVISAWLLKRGKPTLYTVIPALFMLVTTLAALLWQAYQNLVKAEEPNYVLGVTAIVLLALALVLAYQARQALFTFRQQKPVEADSAA
jgi:carbon starvation protein